MYFQGGLHWVGNPSTGQKEYENLYIYILHSVYVAYTIYIIFHYMYSMLYFTIYTLYTSLYNIYFTIYSVYSMYSVYSIYIVEYTWCIYNEVYIIVKCILGVYIYIVKYNEHTKKVHKSLAYSSMDFSQIKALM